MAIGRSPPHSQCDRQKQAGKRERRDAAVQQVASSQARVQRNVSQRTRQANRDEDAHRRERGEKCKAAQRRLQVDSGSLNRAPVLRLRQIPP